MHPRHRRRETRTGCVGLGGQLSDGGAPGGACAVLGEAQALNPLVPLDWLIAWTGRRSTSPRGKRPRVEPIAGSCLCGAVTFSVEPPTLFAWHCHCSICRRSHGAAYATWAGVKSHQLTIITGYDDLVSYPSSPWAHRRFCRHCGSPLFFNADRYPGEIHVAVASLSWPLDRLPDRHVFFDDHAPWADISDKLPRYGGPDGLDPL